ncbi:acetylcholinesterase-1-like [Oppia nitens]|uniref:acetylcholinesterase-1-like n=1 Tax=Oppia nitens TaxID=1686743 RepID=UPI0023DA222E|nr:acetylcholinesterase-1-like [Oppia nitens]
MNTRVMTDYEFRQWIALKAMIGNTATMCPTIGGFAKLNKSTLISLSTIATNSDQSLPPLVTTSSGVVRGQTLHLLNKYVDQYLNIPFAEPPVGRLRFARPVPLKAPKNDIIDGTESGNSCIQDFFQVDRGLTESEDCLVLNVWTPSDAKSNSKSLKPVMFYIYGGGFVLGSIFDDNLNGSVLATHDVVIVSANYRVGSLGFLYGADDSAPGNLALYDQLLALKWFRDNAQAFGGDRDQITIFGQSAGSWSVSAQIMSPLSKGLFRRAIMQSGAHINSKDQPIYDTVNALEMSKLTASQLGCDPYDYHWLDCLRDIPDPQVFRNKPENYSSIKINYPAYGSEFLPQLPQKVFKHDQFSNDIDLMAGSATHEGPMLYYAMQSNLDLINQINEQLFSSLLEKLEKFHHNLDIDKLTGYYLNNTNLDNSKELYMSLGQLYGDLAFQCPTYMFAKLYAKYMSQSAPAPNVYYYQLAYKSVNHFWKPMEPFTGHLADDSVVHHGCDNDFIFGLPVHRQQEFSEQDYDFSLYIMKLWTDFAKYGKPSNDWPKLFDTTDGDDNRLVSKLKILTPYDLTRVEKNPFDSTCDVITLIYVIIICLFGDSIKQNWQLCGQLVNNMNTRVMTDYEFRQWIALKAMIGNTATMCPTIGGFAKLNKSTLISAAFMVIVMAICSD